MSKMFNPDNIKVFDTKTVLQDMVDAEEGTVFILGEKHIKNPEGDDTVEMTFVQIQKVRDSRGFHGLENRKQAIEEAPTQQKRRVRMGKTFCRACGKTYEYSVTTIIIGDSNRCYRCWSEGMEVKR